MLKLTAAGFLLSVRGNTRVLTLDTRKRFFEQVYCFASDRYQSRLNTIRSDYMGRLVRQLVVPTHHRAGFCHFLGKRRFQVSTQDMNSSRYVHYSEIERSYINVRNPARSAAQFAHFLRQHAMQPLEFWIDKPSGHSAASLHVCATLKTSEKVQRERQQNRSGRLHPGSPRSRVRHKHPPTPELNYALCHSGHQRTVVQIDEMNMALEAETARGPQSEAPGKEAKS